MIECEDCTLASHIFCAISYRSQQLLLDIDSVNFWQVDWRLDHHKPEESEKKAEPKKGAKAKKKSKKVELEELIYGTFGTVGEKNWYSKNRGGSLKILCEQHREKMVYCICRKNTETPELMICCDNCEIWFHGKCVGLNNSEVKSIKKWYCSFCTEWINNKNNFLIREASEDHNMDLIEQAKESKWKLPVIHQHIQYRLIDLIFISILYQRKAEILINNACSIDLLQNHIELGYRIPFMLNSILSRLAEKLALYQEKDNQVEAKELTNLKELGFRSFYSENEQ